MRWIEPCGGDTRVRKKFLFKKRTFKGETRWLEFADVKERYVELDGVWIEIGFVDDDISDKLEEI